MPINQSLLKNMESAWHLQVTNLFATVAIAGGLSGYQAGQTAIRPGGPMGLNPSTPARRRVRPSRARARTTTTAAR